MNIRQLIPEKEIWDFLRDNPIARYLLRDLYGRAMSYEDIFRWLTATSTDTALRTLVNKLEEFGLIAEFDSCYMLTDLGVSLVDAGLESRVASR